MIYYADTVMKYVLCLHLLSNMLYTFVITECLTQKNKNQIFYIKEVTEKLILSFMNFKLVVFRYSFTLREKMHSNNAKGIGI